MAEQNNNIELAVKLYEDAAKLGSHEAEYKLGLLLIKSDFYKALYFMSLAAKAEYSDAQVKLKQFQSTARP